MIIWSDACSEPLSSACLGVHPSAVLRTASAVEKQFPVRGSRFPVCSPFSAFCLPSSGLRPVAYRLRPPIRSGASSALKFSAEFQVFAATEGRREASYYGRMIESGSRRQANEFTVIGWQFPAKDGRGLGMQAADNRAKRTQFPAGRRTPPFQHSMIPVFQSNAYRAKQSQFHPSAREWARAAGAGRRQRAKDAKRTQFGSGFKCQVSSLKPERRALKLARYPMIPVFHHSTIPIQCQLCKTNPIWPGSGRAGSRRTKDAKRTQFLDCGLRPPVAAGGDNIADGGLETDLRRDASPALRPTASALRRAKCAKRTQFPAGTGGTRLQGRGTRGKCAKRSQFRRDRAGRDRGV